MINPVKFTVSPAPFIHNGSSVTEKHHHMMLALVPALLAGLATYGLPAVGVVGLAVASAILWELAYTRVTKQSITIWDGQAALFGLLFGMLCPSTLPWWTVVLGTFLMILVGKQIFGGIGCNPFHPTLLALAMVSVSWQGLFDLDVAMAHINLGFPMVNPLVAAKHFGTAAVSQYTVTDLLLGRQLGLIGATGGLALILGGVYLILRGFIRWEISLTFIAGVLVTALLFHVANPAKYAGPLFHLLTGSTLMGAFFLATDDSSSPVNFLPMLLYGFIGGLMVILIRNIGAYADGVLYAILVINLINPLLDKIKIQPKMNRKAVDHA